MYVSGPSDRKFVAFYAVVLTLIRYFVNEILLEGLASVGGVKPEKRGRFKDQGWQCMYYLAAFVTGLNLLADTEWGQALFAGDTKPLFQDYPVGHIELTASFKYYYLLQVPFMPPPRPLSAFCFVRPHPAVQIRERGWRIARAAVLLGAPAVRALHRGVAQGHAAVPLPPHHHHRPPDLELLLQLHSGRHRHPGRVSCLPAHLGMRG